MNKLPLNKNAGANTRKKIGFYIALGICLIAVGIAVYIGVSSTVDEINEDKTLDLELTESTMEEDPLLDEDETQDVDQTQSDVPVEESNTVSETESASASVQTSDTQSSKAVSFALPLEGDTLNAFSNGELVKSKTLNEWRTHDGVDLKASAGTPVKAASDGVIESIEEDPMWGVCVTISHGDQYESIYCGLKPNVPVKKGAEVKIGDIIGYVGNTAEIEIAEDSHLHFAIKKDGSWIDPMSLMK
jgi:murein DD-endopeptidase MepM/ murein hydrolase activator NlpD